MRHMVKACCHYGSSFAAARLMVLAFSILGELAVLVWSMDALTTLVGIEAIRDASGLSVEDVAFLNDEGFSSIRLFARAANSPEKLVERLGDPYGQGVFVSLADHKASRDAEITEAIFLVAWDQAKTRRDRELTDTSVGVLPPAPVGHEPPTSAFNAPTLLSAADWTHGADRSEAQWGLP